MLSDDSRGLAERALALAADRRLELALDDLARLDRASPGRTILAYQLLEELLAPEGRWDEVVACWSRLASLSRDPAVEARLARARAQWRARSQS